MGATKQCGTARRHPGLQHHGTPRPATPRSPTPWNPPTPRSPTPWNPRPPTPRSPTPWNPHVPQHPSRQRQGTPDTQAANAREPPTPRSPTPWNPRHPVGNAREPAPPRPPTPSRQRQGTPPPPPSPDTQVANARKPPTQHETSDNEASSGDEDQWEDPLPAIDDTPTTPPSEQPSQKATARQLSVTKKTRVSGKKQARDSKKKTELVNRGRQLARVHGKQS